MKAILFLLFAPSARVVGEINHPFNCIQRIPGVSSKKSPQHRVLWHVKGSSHEFYSTVTLVKNGNVNKMRDNF